MTKQTANLSKSKIPTVIIDVEQIATLPWKRHRRSLTPLVTRFVVSQTDPKIQKRALYLMGKHSFGFDQPVTDLDLECYLDDVAMVEAYLTD